MAQIYVLPTEEGFPPRAVVAEQMAMTPIGLVAEGGAMLTWSADVGTWVAEGGIPVPEELGAAVTERCRELGVEM